MSRLARFCPDPNNEAVRPADLHALRSHPLRSPGLARVRRQPVGLQRTGRADQRNRRSHRPIRVVDVAYAAGDGAARRRRSPSTCRTTSGSARRRGRRRSSSTTSCGPSTTRSWRRSPPHALPGRRRRRLLRRLLQRGPPPRAGARARPGDDHRRRPEDRGAARAQGALLDDRRGEGRRHGGLQRALHDSARRIPRVLSRRALAELFRRPLPEHALRYRRGARPRRGASDQSFPRRRRRALRRRSLLGELRETGSLDLRAGSRHLHASTPRRQRSRRRRRCSIATASCRSR